MNPLSLLARMVFCAEVFKNHSIPIPVVAGGLHINLLRQDHGIEPHSSKDLFPYYHLIENNYRL